MAYISCGKSWRIEFYNVISAKENVQSLNLNQLKLKVNDIYKKNEKITANFEPTNTSDDMTKLFEINGKYLDGILYKKTYKWN